MLSLNSHRTLPKPGKRYTKARYNGHSSACPQYTHIKVTDTGWFWRPWHMFVMFLVMPTLLLTTDLQNTNKKFFWGGRGGGGRYLNFFLQSIHCKTTTTTTTKTPAQNENKGPEQNPCSHMMKNQQMYKGIDEFWNEVRTTDLSQITTKHTLQTFQLQSLTQCSMKLLEEHDTKASSESLKSALC